MKTIAFVVSTLALASWAAAQTGSGEKSAGEPAATRALPVPEAIPEIPATPAAVDGIVYARKFSLEKGYQFNWCKETPIVRSGYLLVLKVDPDLVYARECAEPVLYVGKQTAERLNHGYPSGRVIAIVPGDPDLEKTLIWFGTPELPESVDAKRADLEFNLAKAANIKPLPTDELQAARSQATEELKGKTIVDVLRVAADLIRQYAPEDKHVADSCVPTVPQAASERDPD